MAHLFARSRVFLACGGALLALAACGGGGGGGGGFPPIGAGSDNGSAPQPQGPVAVSGKVVILGPVSDALVCVDRNRNNACDSDEPASAKTGADGAYSFSYTPGDETAASALAASPLIARVDGDNASLPAFSKPFTMSTPAGRWSQINPLSTLVHTGMAAGLSVEVAQAAVALQLELPADQLYDYQGVPVDGSGRFEDNAFTMALVTADALHGGAVLRVIDPAGVDTPTPSDQLSSLSFGSPGDYYFQTYPTDGVVDAATGKVRLTDLREGKTAGAPTAERVLYPQARLGSAGWVRCDAQASFTSTLGSPSRSDYCGDSTRSVGYVVASDIAGRRMAEVVAEMQSQDGNTIFGVDPASAFADPDATFPAGAQLRDRRGVDVAQPYTINNIDTDGYGFTTLEAFIAGSPAASVNLGTGAGTRSLGLYDLDHLLRFAVVGGSEVQYYRCDTNRPTYTAIGNCVAIATGRWELVTQSGVRIVELRDLPQPAVPAVSNTRAYAEYDGQVYQVRRTRPEPQFNMSFQRRLNGVAWEAMKSQLGL